MCSWKVDRWASKASRNWGLCLMVIAAGDCRPLFENSSWEKRQRCGLDHLVLPLSKPCVATLCATQLDSEIPLSLLVFHRGTAVLVDDAALTLRTGC